MSSTLDTGALSKRLSAVGSVLEDVNDDQDSSKQGNGHVNKAEEKPVSKLGLGLIGCVVILIVISSFFRSKIFEHAVDEPVPIGAYMFTYINTSFLSIFLVVLTFGGSTSPAPPDSVDGMRAVVSGGDAMSSQRRDKKATLLSLTTPPSPPLSQQSSACPSPTTGRAGGGSGGGSSGGDGTVATGAARAGVAPLSVRSLARAGATLMPLYFFMAVFYNYALRYTRASDAVTGSMTTPVWTLVLAVAVYKQERLSFSKVLGVLFCLSGVGVVAYAGSEGELGDGVLGDGMAVFSAMLMATYTVVFKSLLDAPTVAQLQVVLGFLGLACATLAWPGMVVLHYAGVEPLQIPAGSVLLMTTAHCLGYTVVFVFLVTFAVALTSPLLVNAGLLMTIPVSVLVEAVLSSAFPDRLNLFGNAFCIVGFLMLIGS